MAKCNEAALKLLSDSTLHWYPSSPGVRRGFCSRCGGNLFWKATSTRDIYVTAGTLDRPTKLMLSGHIFVNSKSDFYEITDGLDQKSEW